MLMFVIQHQPHRAATQLRRELVACLLAHGSTFSRVGASGKPGAVQSPPRNFPAPPESRTNSNRVIRTGYSVSRISIGAQSVVEMWTVRPDAPRPFADAPYAEPKISYWWPRLSHPSPFQAIVKEPPVPPLCAIARSGLNAPSASRIRSTRR